MKVGAPPFVPPTPTPPPLWLPCDYGRLAASYRRGGFLLQHDKGLLAEPLPPWLTCLTTRLDALGVFGGRAANHVLVNEYRPGAPCATRSLFFAGARCVVP